MKIFDIHFNNRLSKENTIWNSLASERVAIEDSQDITLEMYKKLLSTFVVNEKLLEGSLANELPEQVVESLKTIQAMETLSVFDIENALSVMRFFDYDLVIIHRTDMTEDRDMHASDITARSYMIERFRSNSLQISNYYTGTSVAYKDTPPPMGVFVHDALNSLSLSAEELSKVGLTRNLKNYQQLLEVDISTWDYSEVLEYIKARGFELFVIM